MIDFRVWAPHARTVDLRLNHAVHPMQQSNGGWWSVKADAGEDAAYRYSIDGGEPLPDPRSAWQPDGVHGASRMVDHAAFHWHDEAWSPPPLSSAVIYELHIGTFTLEGTFDSAIERLDHLVELGITHIDLMPVNQFSGTRGWGYDGVDLYAPHHAYGGPAGLKRFVDACHLKRLAVLLDVVYNHLGPEGNYLGRFGPYFSNRYSTPWGEAVNLDGADSREVRRFFCDNALMWLRDYHFDGLRLDAVHAIFDSSAIHFLEQLAAEVKELEARLGRQLIVIAESDLNDPRVVTPREAGGYGIDAQWSDDFHHALHSVLTGERSGYYQDFGSLADLAKALRRAFVYDGQFSSFRHRNHGRRPQGLSGSRFVGYLQTHDQVGNRAKGERITALTNLDRVKIGAALVMCSPFVPMLFQGEEFAASAPFLYFTDHRDPDIARAATQGRRNEFAAHGWNPEQVPDPQDRSSFERSKLDWRELEREPHRNVFAWHRQLIALRRSTAALADGRLDKVEVPFSESEQWLALRRGLLAVACNFGNRSRAIPLGIRRVLLSSKAESAACGGKAELAPDSVLIAEVS